MDESMVPGHLFSYVPLQHLTLKRGESLGSVVALDTIVPKFSANFTACLGKQAGVTPCSLNKCVKLVAKA